MNMYLKAALLHWIIACIVLIVLMVSLFGCATHQFESDCSHRAVNRALIAGDKTRICQGKASSQKSYTLGHIEAQKWINNEWWWLTDSGYGVIATKKCPSGFRPIICFDTFRFIELEFFSELSSNKSNH